MVVVLYLFLYMAGES